jgi:hypothetical protein
VPVGIWFGQFNIVGGQVSEEGPFVGIFEGTRSASGVGVYVVAEPVGGATPRLCDEVLDIISRTFGSPEQALTANLLRAAAAAHQHVREWNRMHPGDRTAGVGLSCLAVRADEAYLAQCGPALAIAHTGGRFRVASPAGDDSRRPLGFGDRAAPVFTRFTLRPGDVLVLAFSAADRLLDRGSLISIANTPPEEAMPLLYRRASGAEQFGALYLGALDMPVAVAPAEGYTYPSPQVAPPPLAEQMAPPSASAPYPAPYPAPAVANHYVEPTNGRGQEWYPGSPNPPAPAPPRNALRPPSTLGTIGDHGIRLSRGMLTFLAVVAALVVLLIFVLPALAQRGNDDRFQELIRNADSELAGAGQTSDVGARRDLLNHAESDLIEARGLRPDTDEVAGRLDHVHDAQAALDRIRDLSDLTPLADLSAIGIAPGSPVELAVGARVYLLDMVTGKVLAFDTAAGGRPETVFEEGREIGAGKAGKARHITTVPATADSPAVLLILDANRALYVLSPDGTLREAPFPEKDAWRADTAIAATGDALYLLDAASGQVWRYGGSPAGYEGKPDPLLSHPALHDGVSLSMAGTPVVATTAGRIARISDGRDEDLRPAGLDRPLLSPAAPMASPADGLMYVADRGNQRIVLLDHHGDYQGQLTQRRFTAMRAVALDDAHGLLYAVCGQSLLVSPIPH